MRRLALLGPRKPSENLENKLLHLIIGQDKAIHQIVRAYQINLAGPQLSLEIASWLMDGYGFQSPPAEASRQRLRARDPQRRLTHRNVLPGVGLLGSVGS
jgi:hypothetical protein